MSAKLVWTAVITLHFIAVLADLRYYEPSPKDYGILQQPSLRNNTHNLVAGWRQYGDRLLSRELVKKSYLFAGVVTEDLRYPPWGYNRRENITAITAIDQMAGNTGGFANITSGGVGLASVNIHFRSQRSRSLKFLVEIYGK